MKNKKRMFFRLFFLLIIISAIIYKEEISNFLIKEWIHHDNKNIVLEKNKYTQEIDYEYVQITNDYSIKDYQHLLNMFYTIFDSGTKHMYFYCDDSYKDCLKDVNKLIKEDPSNGTLADLNNFVHPFNTYKEITVTTNNYGKIDVLITKQYQEKEIDYVETELKKVIDEIIKEDMNDKDKIKAFHDYIINHTKYDYERASSMDDIDYETSSSHNAYGLFNTHVALCGGYSDTMSLFLYSLNIPNYRISASNHVWNLLKLEDTWVHLDATWDDPVTNTGSQLLLYDYFLIDNDTLLKTDSVEHNYNKNIYLEAK